MPGARDDVPGFPAPAALGAASEAPAGAEVDPAKPVIGDDGHPLVGGDVALGAVTYLTSVPLGSSELSFAIYRLPTWWGDELGEVTLDFSGSSGVFYVGITDYNSGCWRWQRVDPGGALSTCVLHAGTWAMRTEPPDGASFLAITAPPVSKVMFRSAHCNVTPHPPRSATAQDLGPCPVRFISFMSCAVCPPGGPDERLYAVCYDYTGPVFIAEIEPHGGACRTYPVPRDDHFVSLSTLGKDGKLYFALRESRVWFSFDPATKRFAELGKPDAPDFVFATCTAADGRIWGATYEGLALVYYDPAAGAFTTACPELDAQNSYPRASVEWHGRIYVGIGPERCGVKMFDPAAPAAPPVEILPETMRKPGWASVFLDRTGELLLYYLPVGGTQQRYAIDDSGNLTLTSSAADGLRLADGTAVRIEGNNEYVALSHPTGEERVYFDCDRSSTQVFKLGNGPDGYVYGGSYNCLHLFRLDPQSSKMWDLGNCSRTNGEVFSFACAGPKLYIMSYPQGNLSVYDTRLPYALDAQGMAGEGEDDNPRSLGKLGNFQHRGLATLVVPDGKVYMAMLADYGSTTGSLSVYDPQTGQFTINQPFPGEAVAGLALAGGKLWAVSTWSLFKWDCAGSKVAFSTKPVSAATGTNTRLAVDRNGMLIGVYNGTPSYLYAFDPVAWRTIATPELTIGVAFSMHHLTLACGPDGLVYGLTINGPGGNHLYVVDPVTFEPRTLWVDESGYVYDGFAFRGDEIYLARGSHVLRIRLKR